MSHWIFRFWKRKKGVLQGTFKIACRMIRTQGVKKRFEFYLKIVFGLKRTVPVNSECMSDSRWLECLIVKSVGKAPRNSSSEFDCHCFFFFFFFFFGLFGRYIRAKPVLIALYFASWGMELPYSASHFEFSQLEDISPLNPPPPLVSYVGSAPSLWWTLVLLVLLSVSDDQRSLLSICRKKITEAFSELRTNYFLRSNNYTEHGASGGRANFWCGAF